jgi:16S rRNA (cytosine967-C5)-methyltransferase
VQDEGSQLCALALTRVPLDGPDARWLDLCAGPGGKAALLGSVAALRAGAATGGGAAAEDPRVVAVEVAAHRARLVAATTAGLPVDVVRADGTVAPWRPGWADRVLVDAPCTGLGALRRRPEARWRRGEDDLAELTGTQRALLRRGIEAARPGGVVAYVVCSPHLAETRDAVEDVLAEGTSDLLDAGPYFPADGPTVQLWPHRHGTDAMFCALLRRR